ncbi:MAG: SPOR domain-containing protein [Rhodobacteraceae bacterium]|nr:MAG: SPOR domain-containing protein [Paracoccaceae bacterium]
MRTPKYQFLGLALVVSVSLAACMDGNNATSGNRDATARGAAAAERDVENPSAFSKRETGLWDGRPSLGGVWVAHPDVSSPERVIIRNTESGKETIGALFRRERMNPGPAFQVSGEAANAVGMLAGAPTMLEVVALRIEEAAPAGSADTAAATMESEEPRDIAAAAEAALSADAGAEFEMAQPVAAPEPRRGGLFSRLRSGRTPARDADPVEMEAAGTGEAEMVIATTPLDPLTPASEPRQAPAAAPARPSAPAPAAASAASPLAQPFIQLGIFSVEANAQNAQSMARNAELSARIVPGTAQGNAFWRVVVGPAQTAAEQRQMLEKVKSLGFTDAYAVRR